MLICRPCRTPLVALTGCAVCLPMKPQIMDDEQDEATRPSLSDVGSEAVNALRAMLREGRDLLRDKGAGPRERAIAHNLVVKTANSLAKVLEAARKLQTDGLAAIRNMSFPERAQLYIEWYTGLAASFRGNLREAQDKFEASLKPKELSA